MLKQAELFKVLEAQIKGCVTCTIIHRVFLAMYDKKTVLSRYISLCQGLLSVG